jgi:hypothetical protein
LFAQSYREFAPLRRDDLDKAVSQASNKARLLVSRESARSQLMERIEKSEGIKPSDEIRSISDLAHTQERETRWWKYNCTLLSRLFSTDEYADEYRSARRAVHYVADRYMNPSLGQITGRLVSSIVSQISALHSIWERLDLIEVSATTIGSVESPVQTESNVDLLIERFDLVARQLQKARRGQRDTIAINDEYDVQDLLHALLLIFFEDVRREEPVPSFAGGSAKIDFLIPKLEMGIEVKKSRDTLKDSNIGEELIIDITKYQNHPQCRKLICFVYDPDNLISNPRGVESDLSAQHDKLSVRVMIVPRPRL